VQACVLLALETRDADTRRAYKARAACELVRSCVRRLHGSQCRRAGRIRRERAIAQGCRKRYIWKRKRVQTMTACVACTVASVAVQAASVESGLSRKGAVKDIYGNENESKR